MSRLPEGLPGRIIAILLVAVVAGLGWMALAAPLLDLYAGRADRLTEQRVLLAHMVRLAASVPALRQAAAAAAPASAPAASLLSGDTDAMAGAALQGMVEDMAEAAGASLSSTEALPGEQQDGFRRISLRIALSADWSVLLAMLRAVETSQYLLLVDDLQLHAAARLQVGAATSAAPPMDASFVVLGFRPGSEAAPLRADRRADAATLGR